jgi:hypothetical protein
MIVSTNQPYFAPYPGFFQKMLLSDVMVILDRVQFPRGTTWITRNRLKNDQGMLWMTIPVWKKGLGLQKINEVQICNEGNWRYKHLKSFHTAYGHAPYLTDHAPWLETIFSSRFNHIVNMNLEIIHYVKDFLQIDTKLVLMSTLNISAYGPLLPIEICKTLGASAYLASAGVKKYLNKDLFSSSGIRLKYFKPLAPVYPQLWGDFIPDLSCLDIILNCGEKARDLVRTKISVAT